MLDVPKGMCRIRTTTEKVFPKFKVCLGGLGYVYYVDSDDVNKSEYIFPDLKSTNFICGVQFLSYQLH